MRTVCVIPARYASTRLPGKPLVALHGDPMVAWVIRAAQSMPIINDIIVATDHEDIAAVARQEGVDAVMTDPDLPSGTDRVRAAMEGRDGDIIINLQGDEPGMPLEAVELAHAALLKYSWADAGTACVPIRTRENFDSPNVVKVVRGEMDRALYFSRSPIPSLARRAADDMAAEGYVWGYKHLGLYLYRRETLDRFCTLPPSRLEQIEKLEQLRLLENGMTLACVTSPRDSVGVDVLEDVKRAEDYLAKLTKGA